MTEPTTPMGDATGSVSTLVARLYFDRQLSKVEIGQRLGISRFRVARLLQQARANGRVVIEYRDLPERDRELAHELEIRYGLDACLVAARGEASAEGMARLAAEVVAELTETDRVVGVAWGSTLAAMVAHLPIRRHAKLVVVPLAGGSSKIGHDSGPAELARRFAARLGGSHRDLFAPAFLASAELRDGLAAESEVARVMGEFRRLSTAVIGIGAWSKGRAVHGSSLIASGALAPADLRELRARGAVGELVVHPFDASGRFVAPDLAERAIAVSLDQLRAVRRVVAVAGGATKARAIRGALATGIVRVLVTDADAAAAVLVPEGAGAGR